MSRRAEAGFTLIEIIVAFTILALGLTLLLGTLSGASRQLHDAGDAGRAALVAQSLLDEQAGLPRQPGRWAGEAEGGRYRWQLRISPWQPPGPPPAVPREDPAAARLLHLQLDLQWGAGGPRQQLHVSSLRLVLPPPEAGA